MTSSGAATDDGLSMGFGGLTEPSDQKPPVAPEPVNITKTLRLRYGYGINSFASLAGVNDKTVLRTDQGTYRAIPGNVVQALMRLEPSYTEAALQHEYREYVKSYRIWQQTRKPLRLSFIDYNPTLLGHPLGYARLKSNYPTVMGFCTAFCLHPSTIRRFESGQTVAVPEQLREALRDMGFDYNQINLLRSEHERWRDHYYDGR